LRAAVAPETKDAAVTGTRKFCPLEPERLEQVAELIREAAATTVLPRFQALTPAQIREKGPGDLVTVADLECEQRLTEALTALLPGSAVVGEEAVAADPAVLERLAGEAPLWIIDPVDGTANFARGNPRFMVLVALVHQGRVEAGWLYQPVGGVMLWAVHGGGAWCEGQRLAIPQGRPLTALRGAVYGRAADRVPVARKLAATGRVAGLTSSFCAGFDYLGLVKGGNDFLSFSSSLPWDHAAGVLLASEAGATARFIDGTPYTPRISHRRLLVTPDQASWEGLRELLLELEG